MIVSRFGTFIIKMGDILQSTWASFKRHDGWAVWYVDVHWDTCQKCDCSPGCRMDSNYESALKKCPDFGKKTLIVFVFWCTHTQVFFFLKNAPP